MPIDQWISALAWTAAFGIPAMISCFDAKKEKIHHRGTEYTEKNKGVIPAKAGIHLADNALADK